MAERFGGPYSPEGSHNPDPANRTGLPNRPYMQRRSRAASRARMLFFAPVIILINAFRISPSHLIPGLAAFGILILAAWLTQTGVTATAAFDARKVARKPAIPRKLFATALTGLGLTLAGTMSQPTLLLPIGFGIAGAILHFIAFGPDPLRNKGMEGVDDFQNQRVATAVDEGEKYLTAMRDAILRAGDRKLESRVDQFAATARTMFRTVESDPRDLTAARKYIGVYLMGARDATAKFADHYAATKDQAARASYEALLDDLESHFTTHTQALMQDGRADMDIEIDVLRERLAREG
jgi:5-bromo-4-chloroindolyl phosphate hydrolysis protein